jgi:hypothetical protein
MVSGAGLKLRNYTSISKKHILNAGSPSGKYCKYSIA